MKSASLLQPKFQNNILIYFKKIMFSIHRFLSIDFTVPHNVSKISSSLKSFFAPSKNKRRGKDKIELIQSKAIVSLPSEYHY